MRELKAANINLKELKNILENPEEPITPRFLLTVIKALIGLRDNEGQTLEIDYVWLQFERKYKIDIARKDTLSASIAFYDNPSEFFLNPNVFDKMAIAFNGHNIIKNILNVPTPEEATFAINEARDIVSTILDNKFGKQYPLAPDVAKMVAAIYHHNGLAVFHSSLSVYQPILTDILSPEAKKEIDQIQNAYNKVQQDKDSIKDFIGINNYVASNVVRLFAIDLYVQNMTSYNDSLIDKILKK
jgi:hypothetical protein